MWSIARWLKALLVNIARHQPEVKSYRQKWAFVDLIFRINVASLKVKIMNFRIKGWPSAKYGCELLASDN